MSGWCCRYQNICLIKIIRIGSLLLFPTFELTPCKPPRASQHYHTTLTLILLSLDKSNNTNPCQNEPTTTNYKTKSPPDHPPNGNTTTNPNPTSSTTPILTPTIPPTEHFQHQSTPNPVQNPPNPTDPTTTLTTNPI